MGPTLTERSPYFFMSESFMPTSLLGTLLKALVLMALLLPALNGCASFLDGKYVTKDGKEGPFQPMTDRYAPPKDPAARF